MMMFGRLELRSTASLAALLLMFAATGSQPALGRPSSAYCDGFAKDQAKEISRSSSRGGALGGAARGATGGVIFGAITGNAGRGAAIGAGFGAIKGGVRRDRDYSSIYQSEYNNCMRG